MKRFAKSAAFLASAAMIATPALAARTDNGGGLAVGGFDNFSWCDAPAGFRGQTPFPDVFAYPCFAYENSHW